jgi:NADH-quinone oxidoreductase subunit J
LLFTTYLFPFEVASLILLVAMIGAVILTKKGIMEVKG